MENMINAETFIKLFSDVFKVLFESIDETLLLVIDHIFFMNTGVVLDYYTSSLIGNPNSGMIGLAYAFIFGLLIFYSIKLLLSNITGEKVQGTNSFLFKLIFTAIIIRFSYYILKVILNLNGVISHFIKEIGFQITGYEIRISNLVKMIDKTAMLGNPEFNLVSVNGMLKVIGTVGIVNLSIAYSLRFIYVKLLCVVFPIIMILGTFDNFKNIRNAWFKIFFGLLILQNFSFIILITIFGLERTAHNTMSKILAIGGVYALMYVNDLIKEIFGSVNLNISSGFRSFFRGGIR